MGGVNSGSLVRSDRDYKTIAVRLTKEQYDQLCSGSHSLRLKHSRYIGMLLDKESRDLQAQDLYDLRMQFEHLRKTLQDLQLESQSISSDMDETLKSVRVLCKRLGR